MDEQELIFQAKSGDTDAFEQLISPYMTKVYNIALGILGSVADADDAAQDAFIKAYRYIRGFEGNSSFYTWLYKIVYNCCLDAVRKKKRRPFGFLSGNKVTYKDGNETEKEIIDTSPLPEEIFIRRETQEQIRLAISRLDENYSSIIILRDIEGLSYDDISKILGISLGTVKSRLSRARENLKNKIISDFPELLNNYGVK